MTKYKRFYCEEDIDHRDPGARDRDRVMYSYALQRLAGITQIKSPIDGFVFHSRLTHTLEMAQLGKRLAQKLNSDHQLGPDDAIDPESVEAACLAHDLGHPPFGHTGEVSLNRTLKTFSLKEGFEGNAQSFRIVNVIEPYRPDKRGLNFTRSTLRGVLKYPVRLTASDNAKGVYGSEAKHLEWVLEETTPTKRAIEADLVDIADDIAYATHDLYDFYKGGMIPLFELKQGDDVLKEFVSAAQGDLAKDDLDSTMDLIPESLKPSFRSTHREYAEVRLASSNLIKYFRDTLVTDTQQGVLVVRLQQPAANQLRILKELTSYFVHRDHRIATEREGYGNAVSNIAATLLDRVASRSYDLFPPILRSIVHNRDEYDFLFEGDEELCLKRLVSDYICMLTDDQALALHQSLDGHGSVFNRRPTRY